jgi:anti-sigma regulatory factor (Ser/Thr protein kinase)
LTTLPPTPPIPPDQPAKAGEPGIVIGGDVATAMLRRIALLHGFQVARKGSPCTIKMTLRASDKELAGALNAGSHGYVEIESDLGLPIASLQRLSQPDRLYISVTTISCFSMSIAPILGRWLVDHGWLFADRLHDLELCLHEAISNAVVHGNLGIQHGPGGDRHAFDRFHGEIHARLAIREYARRRVAIDISNRPDDILVVVTDEGEGFQPSSRTEMAVDAKSGRGLHILRQLSDDVELMAGGRCINMMFKR